MRFKTHDELFEMLSFYRTEALSEELVDTMEWLQDITESAKEEGGEILLSEEAGCLVCAYAEEGVPQAFFYPAPLLKKNSEEIALGIISDYCRRGEICEVVSAIPEEKLPLALHGVRHARLDGAGEGYFTLTVETECMLTSDFPELMYDDIYLSEPTSNFADEYKRLIMDEGVNKYTGYDVRRKTPDKESAYIVEEARREFEMGKSVTAFATIAGENGENLFIGEGVLYRFDGRGGAEMSVRLLPEYCGNGYGKKLALALIELGRQMTLSHLYAVVNAENLISKNLFSSIMEKTYDDDFTAIFKIDL